MKSRSKRIVHPILKLMIRTTASLYFEKVYIRGLENIPKEGPVILACNHPNSFLDALIITVYYKRPIYYIARGDAFKKPFGAKVLSFLNNVPIFRKEEGGKNHSKNEETFSYCMDVFNEGDTVLLFSEGLCENEWVLRPLRKGTGRLTFDAWNSPEIGNKLTVIPVATNYSGWHGSGNNTFVELLEPLEKDSILNGTEEGIFLRKFNQTLAARLGEKIASVDKTKDVEAQKTVTGFLLKNFPNGDDLARNSLKELNNGSSAEFRKKYIELAEYIKKENLKYYDANANVVSFLVACFIIPFSVILNIIPYSICKSIAEKTTRKNVFYDSVFFGSLLVLGPIYMILLAVLSSFFTHGYYCFLLPILAMLTAWSYESCKRQIACFMQRKKLIKVSELLNALFGKGNG